jgi:GT2 family glycosyltransferase
MKVAVIFLDYERHEYTKKVQGTNFNNAGHTFELITIDRRGISAAINEGILKAKTFGSDAVVTMANDIIMPDGWLKAMVHHATVIENTGMCGIHCVEKLPPIKVYNGMEVHATWAAFGNVLIPMKAIDVVGGFNEDYDPYGMQDSDYGYRLDASGFVSYYIKGVRSSHIGHDMGSDTPYRKMKDEGLALSGDKWAKWTKQYSETNCYTINLPEYP